MRIGLVTGEYPPDVGGVGDHTHRLAHELAARGHTVQVLTSAIRRPPEPAGTASSLASGSPQACAPVVWRLVGRWDWRILGTVARLASRERWDVLHVQYQPGAFGLRGAITLLPGWVRGRPAVVTTFHDLRVPYLFPKAGPLRPLAVRHLARSCHGIAAAAGDDLRTLEHWTAPLARPPVVRQIPLGNALDAPPPPDFDRATWRTRLGLAPGADLAGHFGFVNRSKGVAALLRAVARLAGGGRDVHLLMIGDPLGTSDPTNVAYLAEVRRLVDDLRLGGRVHWTGPCPAGAVTGWLRCLDVAVLPFADGASLRRTSIMAAWAQGLPVLTTAPAPGAEWTAGPPTAMTLPVAGPEPLAAALAALLDDPQQRAALGAAGARFALRFSWDAVAAATLDLYGAARALAGHPAGEAPT